MNQNEMMYKVEQILENTRVAVLATIDEQGNPRMRWMTPAVVRGRSGALFAVTSPDFHKIVELNAHADVQWMIQTRALDRVINLKGKINVLENPSIRSEVMEHLGRQLTVFWRV
ncbi:MAG: pyridoxamine 5'-phosphate oxidase family protein, partial [bacterium]|nr:pyridoxamine 5'-phosphate oxidase family protein [bacterium]